MNSAWTILEQCVNNVKQYVISEFCPLWNVCKKKNKNKKEKKKRKCKTQSWIQIHTKDKNSLNSSSEIITTTK